MNNALITCEQRALLLANGRKYSWRARASIRRLWSSCSRRMPARPWLLTEIDPDDHDHVFGLSDLGLGMPEIGWVSLQELAGDIRWPDLSALKLQVDTYMVTLAWMLMTRPRSGWTSRR